MSVPDHIFVDTGIFDKASYNFNAGEVAAFLKAIEGRKLTLLLPDPTEREIYRHIKEWSDAAINALYAAAKEARLLRQWEHFPANKRIEKISLETATRDELEGFLENFEVKKLGCKSVDVAKILDWRDGLVAPFSEGKKNEYPDAIAVEILDNYRKDSKRESIAIISTDGDWERVCKRVHEFVYYPSLSKYAEAVTREDERTLEYLELMEPEVGEVMDKIAEEFADSAGFTIDEDWLGDVEDPKVEFVHSAEWQIAAIGEKECLVRFDANLTFSAWVSYDDYETAVYDGGEAFPLHRITGRIRQNQEVTGTVKMRLSADEKKLTIERIEFDELDFTITERPEEDYGRPEEE